MQRTFLSHSCVTKPCSISGYGFTSISSAERWPNEQPLWLLHHPGTAWAWLHSTKWKEKQKLLKIHHTNQFSLFLLCCFSFRAGAWFGLKHSGAKSCVQTVRPRKEQLGQEVLQECCCCWSWTLSQTTVIFIGSYSPLWHLHQYFTPALMQWGKGTDLRKSWLNPHTAGSTLYLCCNYKCFWQHTEQDE